MPLESNSNIKNTALLELLHSRYIGVYSGLIILAAALHAIEFVHKEACQWVGLLGLLEKLESGIWAEAVLVKSAAQHLVVDIPMDELGFVLVGQTLYSGVNS